MRQAVVDGGVIAQVQDSGQRRSAGAPAISVGTARNQRPARSKAGVARNQDSTLDDQRQTMLLTHFQTKLDRFLNVP